MSTRACYVFQDAEDNFAHVVYKHHDGYPEGAIGFIAKARALAWPLPRFEADEFAASFVAANKDRPGDVRLVGYGDWTELAPGDIEYVYIIRTGSVTALSVSCDSGKSDWTSETLFTHSLADIENAPAEAAQREEARRLDELHAMHGDR